MVGTGWLGVGLVSQLVMRSFDVADKGELSTGDGPLGRRDERTPDHNRHGKKEREKRKKDKKKKKMRDVWVEVGSGAQTGQVGTI